MILCACVYIEIYRYISGGEEGIDGDGGGNGELSDCSQLLESR